MDMSEVPSGCYYEPRPVPADGDAEYEYFQPTEATASVWSSDMQHGGPPSGLLMRAMMRAAPDDGQVFTRVTNEIIGPIGLGVNRVRATIPRPGRRISMIQADLEAQLPDGSFRLASRAVAWRMLGADSTPIAHSPVEPLPASPDQLKQILGFPTEDEDAVPWGMVGFIGKTITARQPGRNGSTPALWIRPALDLVAGEQMSNLEAVFTVIDIANGVGTRVDPQQWSWMNMDTTVHLVSQPTSPWLGIDSDLAIGSGGYGASFADLYDVTGFLGRSAQSDMIAPQG
ncbi:MAG: thioesterase family protein [Gordonia sp.]|nr:thioesterase family protein [Gordonia sp. (in: high G+C Gram-positive bacteria)]NLG47061.1 thioesterase family protein [Gordonia sp. (in: high G+C Gram-positive bacteria)]